MAIGSARGSAREDLRQDADLSLYVSYDDGVAPEFSIDSWSANAPQEGCLIEAGSGEGRSLSFRNEGCKVESLSYPVAKAFDTEKGTLMFWFRPGWDGREVEGKYTLAWVNMKGSERYFALHRSFSKEHPQILFANFHWDNVLQIDTRQHFLRDQWLHIAVTWSTSNAQFAFYINGVLAAERPFKPLPHEGEYQPTSLQVGKHYSVDSPINADYDDLFLLRRALSPSEISQYVEESQPR